MWKLGNVAPIFKNGNRQLIKNYRPISLLPVRGNILEKMISDNLYIFLHTGNLIKKSIGFSSRQFLNSPTIISS